MLSKSKFNSFLCFILQPTPFIWILLFSEQSILYSFGIRRSSSLSPTAKISTRLTLSVCEQRLEFFQSKTLQTPVKSGAEFKEKNDKVQKLGCGWFDFRLADSESTVKKMYKTCKELEKTESETSGAESRIIGGLNATKGQFPSIVSLGRLTPEEAGPQEFIHFCGGTIIDKEWILTARHCVSLISHPVNAAMAGEHIRSVNESTEQYVTTTGSWSPPQESGSDYLDHDILLLKVSPPLTFNEFVAPASLPPADYEPSGTLVIAGWGLVNIKSSENSTKSEDEDESEVRSVPGIGPTGDLADILQWTEIPIVPREECREALGSRGGSPNLVCTGFEDGHANLCYGDSGGPLYATIEDKVTVVGVASSLTSNDKCAEAGKPGVYLKVSFQYYMDWIKKTIEENS